MIPIAAGSTWPSMFKKAISFGLLIGAVFMAESRAQTLKPNFLRSHPTGRLRDILQSPAAPLSAAADTLQLLALRVEFRLDSVSTTTGNGRFDLSNPVASSVDAPPHNRDYFIAQLTALKNYYHMASGGKLQLQAEIFPLGRDAAYQLPRSMSYYSPGKNSPQADQRLAELFRDAVQAADQDGGIDFSRFDCVLIFHAGVGNDFDIEFDSTPNDVPSAFLSLNDLRATIGNNDPAYRGIDVEGGTAYVSDGIILPETQSQENVEFGLLGTMALMFGYQLGLPNLFDTDNGLPGIGRWGLMDQGSGNYQGLLPAFPSAWERVFLGWEQPVTITEGDNFRVAALLAGDDPKIYKIPISDNEYFLIENRQRDVIPDGVAIGHDVNDAKVEFKFDNAGNPFLAFDPPLGVIIRVDEYDFGLPFAFDENNRVLPAAGILIWHIDEQVIRENYAANRVNADRDRRGVDLEEADGAQDLGRVYGFLDAGAGAENGVAEDAWWNSNPVITEVLRPGQPVTFGPSTLPSSASNSGARTGIFITDFSAVKSVMTFSVHNAFTVSGFPQYAGGAGILSPMLGDLTGDGQADIVVASASGEIFAWDIDGNKIINNADSISVTQPNGRVARLAAARFAVIGDSLFQPPVLIDLDDDGRNEVLTLGKDGVLRAWQAADQNQDGRADLLWLANLGAPSRVNLAVRNESKKIFCAAADQLFAYDRQGQRLWQYTLAQPVQGISLLDADRLLATEERGYEILSDNGAGLDGISSGQNLKVAAAIADLENDGGLEAVLRQVEGELRVRNLGRTGIADVHIALSAHDEGNVAIGDVDADGRKEIVAISANQIYAYHFNGALADNFPRPLGNVNSSSRSLAPILADVDGDGAQDVIVAGQGGDVYAYGKDGKLKDGFPLAMAGPGNGSAATADLDGDGRLELVAVSGNGFVHVWRMPQSATDAAWPMLAHDAAHTSLNRRQDSLVIRADGLMPPSLVYNYPNPTEGVSTTIRYRLNQEARVKIAIYDVAGDLVDELSGPGVAQAENEVTWNLQNVESGVYLARVEAQGSQETQVAMIKIAVVK
jgi:M6 family metalloprotease-like protein